MSGLNLEKLDSNNILIRQQYFFKKITNSLFIFSILGSLH